MTRKTQFNWSLLNRYNLYSMLYSARAKVVNKKLTVDKIHAILRKHVKSHLPIRVKLDRDANNDAGIIYVGGLYDSIKDRKGSRAIELVLSYNPNDSHIKLTSYRWTRMCWLFADTILHEIIHMRQYRARSFKPIPGYQSTAQYAKERKEQEYYGDKDEIGAFSFNIACELYDRFGNDYGQAVKYMNSDEAKRHKRTTYYRYLKTFDFNHNHPIIKTVKKRIKFYLPYAPYGKPFVTTDHLTY